ncbi:PIN domain-containing protein [Knoellia koreensis]|uniref:Ribonuclease VapC n=1 Tax=Knoellia koreensis TaxID=2730921 RepID=A0A849HNJ7_9MICO|nr:PIN domain-containing protein [Knoellia sp. DB2414S]NNM48114.1 PIN domain-containing protein [Knoellia sp. DB2414S]
MTSTETTPQRALADTSVLTSGELGRPIDRDRIPAELAVCVVTIAELQAGVLAAADSVSRSRRLATLHVALDAEVLQVDVRAAQVWAELRVRLRDADRRVNVNDLWIAAIAISNDLPVVSQDGDFDPLAEIGALQVIKV